MRHARDVDEIGQLLFGRRCRLRLALWIWRRAKADFYQSEPPREVVLQSDAAKELGQLVLLGMIEKQHRENDRRIYYERLDGPLWEVIGAVAAAVGIERE